MSNKTDRIIEPLSAPLDGATKVPGDKSISHRAVLFSAMAEGTSRITGLLDSADVRSSIDAVEALGATVKLEKQVDGSLEGGITGWGSEGPKQPSGPIDCGNSGTTARLLMGVIAPWNIEVTITGDDSLKTRPMRRITAPLMKMGVRFTPEEAEHLPVTEHGNAAIKNLTYDAPMASAQLKTAILLAGLGAKGKTTVNEPAVSRNHTELMLPEYGAQTTASLLTASVTGPRILEASEVDVAGDPSSAAFLVCAAVLKRDSSIQIENVSLNTGRIGFTRTLERMNADITVRHIGSEGKEPYGFIAAAYNGTLKGCEIPAEKIASVIDEIPVLALVASQAKGITVFRGCSELRKKESDRLQAVIDGLEIMGVDAWTENDDLFIEGQPGMKIPDGLVFDSLGDHRLAMTWALVGLCFDKPVTVKGFDCIDVSYPNFIEDIRRIAL